MINTYRDNSEIRCSICGSDAIVPNYFGYKDAGMFGTQFRLAYCLVCTHYTAYIIDRLMVFPGEQVTICSKTVDPKIGSHAPLDMNIHFFSGNWEVVSINPYGGVFCRSLLYPWRAGVFHKQDLVRCVPPIKQATIIEIIPEVTKPSSSWRVKLRKWWDRVILRVRDDL